VINGPRCFSDDQTGMASGPWGRPQRSLYLPGTDQGLAVDVARHARTQTRLVSALNAPQRKIKRWLPRIKR
jgi:hypothetical protein